MLNDDCGICYINILFPRSHITHISLYGIALPFSFFIRLFTLCVLIYCTSIDEMDIKIHIMTLEVLWMEMLAVQAGTMV